MKILKRIKIIAIASLFVFSLMLNFGLSRSSQNENIALVLTNSEALADFEVGRICCNNLPGCCQWFNEDGSLDYENDGDWAE